MGGWKLRKGLSMHLNARARSSVVERLTFNQ
jgi:hypothetical protein